MGHAYFDVVPGPPRIAERSAQVRERVSQEESASFCTVASTVHTSASIRDFPSTNPYWNHSGTRQSTPTESGYTSSSKEEVHQDLNTGAEAQDIIAELQNKAHKEIMIGDWSTFIRAKMTLSMRNNLSRRLSQEKGSTKSQKGRDI